MTTLYKNQDRFGSDIVRLMRRINALEWNADNGYSSPHSIFVNNSEVIVGETNNARSLRLTDINGNNGRTLREGGFRSQGIFATATEIYAVFGTTHPGLDNVYVYDYSGNVVRSWGRYGTGNDHYDFPLAIWVEGGSVYVYDAGNDRIKVTSTTGTYIRQWSEAGLNSFTAGIQVYNSEVYYTVADEIIVTSTTGTPARSWGSSGSGNDQYQNIGGIWIENDKVYAADTGNHRIKVTTTSGVYSTKWGTQGSGNNQFDEPKDIMISGGEAYITDFINHRIMVTSTTGTFDRKWGYKGSTFPQTEWFSYDTDTTKSSLGIPDSGILIPALGSLDKGIIAVEYITGIQQGVRDLATSFPTVYKYGGGGNNINWFNNSPDNLHWVAVIVADYNTTAKYVWEHEKTALLSSFYTHDISLGTVSDCLDELETCDLV